MSKLTENKHDDETRTISHVPYPVSFEELTQAWLAIYAEDSCCLAIYDPQSHVEYLSKTGLMVDKAETYNSKILIIKVTDLDDALWLCQNIPHEAGPYVQVWVNSELLTDNIDK